MNENGQIFSDMVDAVPIFGLVKGLIHLASGDVIAGQRCLIFSSIVSVVLVVGYFAFKYGGVLIAICAGVGAIVIMRGLTRVNYGRYAKWDTVTILKKFIRPTN
jgi:hypothetical protein